MPKDEWGLKRLCPSCSSRFYDLQHDPMTCPVCGASFSLESLTAGKPRPARLEKTKPQPARTEDAPSVEAGETVENDDEREDGILEDEEENVDLDEIADVAAEDDDS